MDVRVAEVLQILAHYVESEQANVVRFPSLLPILRMRKWVERRITRRVRVYIPVSVNQNDEAVSAIVTDISPNGACISQGDGLQKGDLVTITIGTYAPLPAEVIWCARRKAGVKFKLAH